MGTEVRKVILSWLLLGSLSLGVECRVPKIFLTSGVYTSPMGRLTQEQVWIVIKRKEKGLSSALIARQLSISKRRVNQIWEKYETTGKFELRNVGRPATRVLSEREKTIILRLHEHQMMGARIIGRLIRFRYGTKIGNNLIHKFLLNEGMAEPNGKKQKRRKPWVRYERRHSLSAGHMDWHTANWQQDVQVCTVIDDSSRKILSAVECENATEEEAQRLVQNVLDDYGHIRRIREIITDHGSQFFSNTPNKKGEPVKGSFQKYLEAQGIKHIICRYKHPQSNGKQEKWFDTYERHRKKFNSMQEFVTWYNETRVHESLDLRTPEKVFWERLEPFVWQAAGKCLRRWSQ